MIKFIAGLVLACASALTGVTALAEEQPRTTVKVMTFNIWLGGDQVNFGKVIEAIKAADADIVCLQEAGGQTLAIAEALGWSYAAPNRHVIARVPLFVPTAETQGADGNDLNT